MPVKVKKEKLKQKQKQSQKQIVNIKIGETKKPVKRRRVGKATKPLIQQTVQPVQYLYQATGSIPQPFQNMGVGTEPRKSLLAERPEVRQPQGIEQPLQLEVREPVRENLLGGGELSREDIRQRRVLRLSQPEEPSMFQNLPVPPVEVLGGVGGELSREDIRQRRLFRLSQPEESSMFQNFPPPPLESLGGGASLEDFPPPERFPTLGQVRTSPARETRRVLQISEGAGSNVPLEFLIQGKYNLKGEPRRAQPTVNQRERLLEAGYQVKEPTPKKKKGKKDA